MASLHTAMILLAGCILAKIYDRYFLRDAVVR